MDGQKFCLKWDSFQSSVTSLFDHLRQDGELVDVTLGCEGQKVKAHRMMLSACSPYFRDLLKDNPCQHMVIFLKDTSAADLCALMDFMYTGSVNIAQSQLASFIKTAEMLQIRGLSGDEDKPASPRLTEAFSPARKRRRCSGPDPPADPPAPPPPPPPPALPPAPPQAAPRSDRSRPAVTDATDVPRWDRSRQPAAPEAPPEASPQAEAPPPPPHVMKVEKVDVDLTEEEDESLDATLGYVAEYDSYNDQELSREGFSDQELALGAVADPAAIGGGAAGPSQRPGEDGAAQGSVHCDVCGNAYSSDTSMKQHRKSHFGVTRCPLCGKVSSRVGHLRRHLSFVHGMTREDVLRMVPFSRPGVE